MTRALSAKRMRPVLLVAGAVGLVVAAGGCGSVKRFENPNLVEGKIAFVERCGSCHTLARAGTQGIVGPNLDQAFAASIDDGLGRTAIDSVVSYQIHEPNPGGAMPANLATGSIAQDIAAYIAEDADRPGQDTGLLAQALSKPGNGPPAEEKNGVLQIDADPTGQLSFTTRKASATAGQVTIKMDNMSMLMHNIALQPGTGPSGPVLGHGSIVGHGGVSTFTVNLKPGTYTYFCQVPGHRAAGMFGTLTVK